MRKPRFILFDPWLSDAGGHNFQYALDVAGAAQRRGYDVVLAVHRSLPGAIHFSPAWRVLRTYRFGACARYWLGPLGRNRHPCDLDGNWLPEPEGGAADRRATAGDRCSRLWQRWVDWPARLDRRRRILDFSRGCTRSLDLIEPESGDLFFLPSMSEFDFVGLARFLRDDPRTRGFVWHLQFHFNIFDGREPEFAGQRDRLIRFQRQLHAARAQIPGHQLRLYATTDAMARQFDDVEMGSFQPLPYPVREVPRGTADTPDTAKAPTPVPLRVTFAGAMRREKGKRKLGSLIAAVWSDCLATGRMQFLFQSTPRHIARWLPRDLRSQARIASPGRGDPTAFLRTVPHPLDAPAYAELIRGTDVGVFLYDSRRYYARASGILCEMLAAGVPVIVPAGCWLSDQITGENQRHVAELATLPDLAGAPLRVELENKGGELVAACTLPDSASDLAIQWNWPATLLEGIYVRATAEFTGPKQEALSPAHCGIVGRPDDDGCAGTVIPLPPGARHVRLTLSSAYGPQDLAINHLRIVALNPPFGHQHHPRGSVGLIASDEGQVPDLLREMLAHYQHYRQTAGTFAQSWVEQHAADRTLELLEAPRRATPGQVPFSRSA